MAHLERPSSALARRSSKDMSTKIQKVSNNNIERAIMATANASISKLADLIVDSYSIIHAPQGNSWDFQL